jgi:hypothetical protein
MPSAKQQKLCPKSSFTNAEATVVPKLNIAVSEKRAAIVCRAPFLVIQKNA